MPDEVGHLLPQGARPHVGPVGIDVFEAGLFGTLHANGGPALGNGLAHLPDRILEFSVDHDLEQLVGRSMVVRHAAAHPIHASREDTSAPTPVIAAHLPSRTVLQSGRVLEAGPWPAGPACTSRDTELRAEAMPIGAIANAPDRFLCNRSSILFLYLSYLLGAKK